MKKGISENFNSIIRALIAMDVQNAEAVNPKDRNMIFAVIKKECGFDMLNNMVKNQLRKWYVETGADIADVIMGGGGDLNLKNLGFICIIWVVLLMILAMMIEKFIFWRLV